MTNFTPAQAKIARDVADRILDGKTLDEKAIAAIEGQRITVLELTFGILSIECGNVRVQVQPTQQSCCESRYLVCDDDLLPFVGKKFVSVIEKTSLYQSSGDVHEIAFYEFVTSGGSFTLASHNEHNGYYGGTGIDFSMRDS